MPSKRGSVGRSVVRFLAVGLIALPLGACNTDQLLDVTDPALVPPEGVGTPEAVGSLINGALRDFYIAYSGAGDDAYIATSGDMSDELYNGDTFTTRIALDQRRNQSLALGNSTDAPYSRLHKARTSSRRAAYAVKVITQSATDFARLRAIEGYTWLTFAEGWCSNVPFSTVPDSGAIDPANIHYNAPITTQAMLDSAISRFNEALASNPTDRLAQVGKARALLGKTGATQADQVAYLQQAAAVVAAIPSTSVVLIEHSPNSAGQNNPIWSLMANGRYGVSNLEGAQTAGGAAIAPDDTTGIGGSGLPRVGPQRTTAAAAEGIAYRGLQDPRVSWRYTGGAFSSATRKELFDMNNPNAEADIPLASGVEAKLIVAEAQLAAGDVAGWLTTLNALRANPALITILHPQQIQVFPTAMAPLADPGTATGRVALMFQERALWLFDTGHRLGDMRRLVRNYDRLLGTTGVYTTTSVFPSGPYYRGGTYGTDVSFLVPQSETNNPFYVSAQCVTSTP